MSPVFNEETVSTIKSGLTYTANGESTSAHT